MIKRLMKNKRTNYQNNIRRNVIWAESKTVRRRKKGALSMGFSQVTKSLSASFQPVFWRKNWRMFLIFLGGSFCIALYIFAFYSRFFIIDDLIINRQDLTLDKDAILEVISEDIYGENIITLDTDEIKSKLADEFPAMGYSNIYKVFPRTIEIEVDNFDDAVVVKDPLGKSYTVNEIGMIVSDDIVDYNLPVIEYFDTKNLAEWEEAHKEPEEVNPEDREGEIPVEEIAQALAEREALAGDDVAGGDVVLENQEGVVRKDINESAAEDGVVEEEKMYSLGDFIITSEQIAKILEVEDEFERKMGLNVDSVKYYPIEREVRIVVASAFPFEVWVDMQIPLDEQIYKLKAMQGVLNFESDPIDYIDLRISGDKVFYRSLE